jgi:predicted nucleic acid-binding protein
VIVVADTSPLQYLIEIESLWVLPQLYGNVYLPAAVLSELRHPKAPRAVRAWSEKLPEWIHIREPHHSPAFEIALGSGERDAIALATEMRADWLLMDERDGTEQARRLGLKTIGVLGILLAAARENIVDARALLVDLRTKTRFFISKSVEDEFVRLLSIMESN